MANVCLQMAFYISEDWICERIKLDRDHLGNISLSLASNEPEVVVKCQVMSNNLISYVEV